MKEMIKKLVCILFAGIALFWCYRIWSINSGADEVKRFEFAMNQDIQGEKVKLKAVKAGYISIDEAQEMFSIGNSLALDGNIEQKVVYVCIEAVNTSDIAIDWSDLMEWIECGFETNAWSGVSLGFITQSSNVFYTESFEPGQTQDIWFATLVDSSVFKEKNWKQLNVHDFYYVLSISPDRMRIRLE
ncbi:MAG: hypothetical protein UEY44_06905 [Coprococcus sp.]|mgnify:FL=1|nr:hypothetical protein [Coprococcus sp.]